MLQLLFKMTGSLMADSFLAELKRRNVFKAATAYIVLGWVVVQVTSEAVPAFGMPEWVNTVVFYFGLIGFPFVMLFAWAFELTPEGIKLESEVERDESITSDTGRKMNYIIMSLLLMALIYFIYESRFEDRTDDMPLVSESRDDKASVTDATIQPNDAKGTLSSLSGASIAVLPFDNMTGDENKEFFSDGISEEILNVLAQIPNLHVTSRSSAFAFKGKQINLSEIADKLGVANILEGSVRMDGNQVRITAQLIEASTDKHLWSGTFDRELNSIFAIQDEISKSIVETLKDKLGLQEEVQIATKAVDLKAHQAYLRGRILVERRNTADIEKAMKEFEQAILIEPTYGKAWMGKAWATLFLSELHYGEVPVSVTFDRAMADLERAFNLDPDLAENYAIKGSLLSDMQRSDEAFENYEKAIELNPNLAMVYVWYGNDVSDFDDPQKRFDLREHAFKLDPLSLLPAVNYSFSLSDHGDIDQAKYVSRQAADLFPASHTPFETLSYAHIQAYEYGEATYYAELAHLKSPTITTSVGLSILYSALGLESKAHEVLKDSPVDHWRFFFTGNMEQYLTVVRQRFPRSESDAIGNFYRGIAEMTTGNYKESIPYLENTFDNVLTRNTLVISYKFADAPEFDEAFAKYKNNMNVAMNGGIKSNQYKQRELDILTMGGDLDLAISLLAEHVKRGFILNPAQRFAIPYEQYRVHPEWAAINAQFELNRDKQRKIYLDLVANDDQTGE